MKNGKYVSKQDLEKLYNMGLEEQRLASNLGLEMYRMGIMKGTKTTCIVMLTGVVILVVQDKISSAFKNKIHKK